MSLFVSVCPIKSWINVKNNIDIQTFSVKNHCIHPSVCQISAPFFISSHFTFFLTLSFEHVCVHDEIRGFSMQITDNS